MHRFFSRSLILLLLILLIADLSIVPAWSPEHFRPVFLFLFILYAAMSWRGVQVLSLAFAVGFLRDLSSIQPFGVSMVSVVGASLILLFAMLKIERQWIVVRMMVAFTYVFLILTFETLLSLILGVHGLISWNTVRIFWGSAFATTALLPVFFWFARLWFHDRQPLRQFELFSL